jgi:hypothetical protein
MNAAAVSGTSSCANSSSSAFGTSDTITFASDVVSVTLADTANNELLITDENLTIQGSGTGGVTISRISGATHAFRIFHDTGVFGEEMLYLSGLTLSNGATTAANAGGGAIFMEPQGYTTARLKLTDCIVSGNSTSGAYSAGGALAGHLGGPASPAHSGTVITLTGSTVSGNSTTNANAGGGAIYAGGATITDSVVTGNSTMGDASSGGGIQAASVAMTSSTISHNSTHGTNSPGGGIAAKSTLYAIGGFGGNYNLVNYNSTAGAGSPGGGIYAASTSGYLNEEIVSNNSTSGDNSNGGGLYVASYYGVSIEASTISNNSVTGIGSGGGGIWSRFGKGSIKEMFSSTLAGNTASAAGGAISLNVCSTSNSRAMNIYNSTLAFNTTSASEGGGVYVGNVGCPAGDTTKPTSALIAITSSIVSNNSSDTATDSDIAVQMNFALTIDTSFALIKDVASGAGITLVNAAGSPALIALDPLLKPLANNGCGRMTGAPGDSICVPTLALGCRSPAYHAGSNPLAYQFDERGTGFPRTSGSKVDIGAYEDDDEIFCNGFELSGAVQ